MKICHGSKDIIKKPKFGYGNRHNDYGLAFYCTEEEELAKEWAVDYLRDGYCNFYELDTTGLKILDLSKKPYNILHWLTILLQNRTFTTSDRLAVEAKEYLVNNFSINYRDYDVIIGYRADDSYFSFAQDFISGTITYQQLSKAMYLGNLGKQVVLVSKKAFEQIVFVKYEFASWNIFYNTKVERDQNARNTYFLSKKMKRNKDDFYITYIIDEGMKSNDKRLQ